MECREIAERESVVCDVGRSFLASGIAYVIFGRMRARAEGVFGLAQRVLFKREYVF